jgi:predicted phosphodiesterase
VVKETLRIAAIADVHGNLGALQAVLAHIQGISSPDFIVNLGDHVSGPLQPRETAELLMTIPQIAIRGNHDRQLLEGSSETESVDRYAREQLDPYHLSWLSGLGATAWIENEVFLCHGTPSSDIEYFLENPNSSGSTPASEEQVAHRAGDCPASLILCGHSHTPRALRLPDGRLIVNPGSVGIPAYVRTPEHSQELDAGNPHTRYALLEHTRDWQVELIEVDYDWQAASRLAASRGRLDWAKVLAGHFGR